MVWFVLFNDTSAIKFVVMLYHIFSKLANHPIRHKTTYKVIAYGTLHCKR